MLLLVINAIEPSLSIPILDEERGFDAFFGTELSHAAPSEQDCLFGLDRKDLHARGVIIHIIFLQQIGQLRMHRTAGGTGWRAAAGRA